MSEKYVSNQDVNAATARTLDALTALLGDLQLLVKKAIEVIDEERAERRGI